MYRKFVVATVAALLVVGMVAGMAFAAVTFDSATGTGFVGKGDVQLVYGWNNKQLQENIEKPQFRANSTVVTEVSWECVKDGSTNTQERARTTTKTIQGVLSSVERVKNQITGYILQGYSGAPTESSTTEGPALGSCPNGWTAGPISDPEIVSSTGGLQVSINGTDWVGIE